MTKLSRNIHIAEKILFIDGIWGTGKSILGPVLAGFKGVEKQRLEHIYEYICTLYFFKKIELDAAVTMLRLYADIALFNSSISREVNLRMSDDSGLLNNPNQWEYIKRLFYKDGDVVLSRIKKSKPILQIMSHLIFPILDPALKAYGDRLLVIEMVRHPLYLAEHWFNYIERCGTDPREFTLWIDWQGTMIPWFTKGWDEKYIKSSTMDKVIYSLDWFSKRIDDTYNEFTEQQKKQTLFIPFEKFVITPEPFINQIELFLSSERTSAVKKALKRQKCPRKNLSVGRGHKSYGWVKPDGKSDNISDFKKRKEFVKARASKDGLVIFEDICRNYKVKYDLSNQSPWYKFNKK
jgi:hypothetical protein